MGESGAFLYLAEEKSTILTKTAPYINFSLIFTEISTTASVFAIIIT